jgi:hypothetical protein
MATAAAHMDKSRLSVAPARAHDAQPVNDARIPPVLDQQAQRTAATRYRPGRKRAVELDLPYKFLAALGQRG